MRFNHQKGKSNSRDRSNENNRSFNNGEFLFNRTSILSSALHILKKDKKPQPEKNFKRPAEEPIELSTEKPTKKVKKSEDIMPLLTYTPLQKDLYNFFTINKITIKNSEIIP
jgi:hypothetical protein